jgi:hypothetical protein
MDAEHQPTDLAVGGRSQPAAASSRLDRYPVVAFVVSAMVGRVRVPAAADVQGGAILSLGRAPGRRRVVAEGATALVGNADPLATCWATRRQVSRSVSLSSIQSTAGRDRSASNQGVVGDPAEKVRARDRAWGPVGRRWWPVIAHGSPWCRQRRIQGVRALAASLRDGVRRPALTVRQRRAAPPHPGPALQGIRWCSWGRRWSVVRSW